MSLDQISALPPAQQSAILNGPALTPPEGVVPDFENPPNQNALSHFSVAFCLIASTFAVLIRAYSRIFCIKKLEIEDYLAVAAFVDFAGFFVHQWDIRVKDLTTVLYIIHIGSCLYAVTMLIMKASILREWIRIFVPRGTRDLFYYVCYTVMSMNICFYIAVLLVENLSCFPQERIWDKTVPGSECLDTKAISVAAAITNIVLDLFTLFVPQKVIWNLHMSTQKKAGIGLLFIIGALACGAAVARTAYSFRFYKSDDTAYTLSAVSLWAIAEMTCMFLVFCGPAAPKAIKSLESTPLLKSWTGSSKTQKDSKSAPSWLQGNSNSSGSNRKYRMLDEDGIPLTNLCTEGPVAASPEHQSDIQKNSGITYTKQFTTGEERVEGPVDNEQFMHQHPWAGRAQ
ncbi:hypothetical protein AAE478_004137 [Parahypoxylon ruwenzoriense]